MLRLSIRWQKKKLELDVDQYWEAYLDWQWFHTYAEFTYKYLRSPNDGDLLLKYNQK